MSSKSQNIKLFIVLSVILGSSFAIGAEMPSREIPQKNFDNFKINNRIDELVIHALKGRETPPSESCSDEVFLRRVYIDVIGTLPSAQEAKSFYSSKDPKKRSKLIDLLLSKNEFAVYWSMKWGDLLRIKAEFPSNLWPNAAQAYARLVHDRLQSNTPYDKFVRELLTASGSNFRDPAVNFYRAFQQRTPQALAENAAQVFMGVRLMESGFSEAQILGMSAFFTKVGYKGTEEWKEEIVYFSPDAKPLMDKDNKPVFPLPLNGTAVTIPADMDPRAVFADWLTSPENPWFSKNIVNRVWYWLLGRGIVNEPDDMRPDNDAWNEELLVYLEKELITHDFDLKHIYRLILNSNTYQLSSKANEWNAEDEEGFSHYRIRRLDAEVIIDAVCMITGTGENYQSAIPEPFTFLPYSQRAIDIADGSITSPVLEMFGKPPRNTSFESERNSVPSVTQVQHFLNSSSIEKKIEQGRLIQQLISQNRDNGVLLNEVYLRILSRFPSNNEKKLALDYMSSGSRKINESVYDIAWALFNTSEFILKH